MSYLSVEGLSLTIQLPDEETAEAESEDDDAESSTVSATTVSDSGNSTSATSTDSDDSSDSESDSDEEDDDEEVELEKLLKAARIAATKTATGAGSLVVQDADAISGGDELVSFGQTEEEQRRRKEA